MRGLALMRRAGEREFFIREIEAIRGAGLDQRQRLQGFGGRARVNWHLRVARCPDGLAGSIHHNESAAMAAFHRRAARHFDQNGLLTMAYHEMSPD